MTPEQDPSSVLERDKVDPQKTEDLEFRAIIHAGDLAGCREIIESGKREVNQADDEGCFMLQWATLSNQPEVMRLAHENELAKRLNLMAARVSYRYTIALARSYFSVISSTLAPTSMRPGEI